MNTNCAIDLKDQQGFSRVGNGIKRGVNRSDRILQAI